MRTTITALPLGLLLLLASCGDDTTETKEPEAKTCQQAAADECRVNQQACTQTGTEVACHACERGHYVTKDGTCAPLGGTPIHHVFAEFSTQPGEEILGLCQSWTLDNDEAIYVNAVELYQTQSSHHSNWLFVPETEYEGPDGVWPCQERGYSQLAAALVGGVLYAQSTQAPNEVQKFPDGAVVRIPPRARIIGDVHVLNVTGEPKTGHAELTLYALSEAEVKVSLAPFHLTYDTLALPPNSSSRFSGTCDLEAGFLQNTGSGVATKLYYSLPHTHALGRRFFLQAVGGPRDGEMLLDVRGFNGEPRGKYYDPVIDLTGITGLRFGCEFENPTSEVVEWGFGDQEMCEMLGFMESPLGFESRIGEVNDLGTVDGMPSFTGACNTVFLPWDSKK